MQIGVAPVRPRLRILRLLFPLALVAGAASAARAGSAENDDLLARGEVVERARNRAAGVNASEVVTLRLGARQGRAIFKPAGGQRVTALGLAARVRRRAFPTREAAASDLAIALGVPYVPRTVEREIGGRRGSLQLWVDDAHRARDHAGPGRTLDREAAEMVRVFDYLIGNSDRSGKNLLVRVSGSRFLPVAIDNANSFPRSPIPRFRWPTDWVAGQTGPLLPQTRGFIAGIDPSLVAGVLQRAGIERDAAVHLLRRLARLQRDASFLEVPSGRAASLRMQLRITRAGRSRSQGLPRAERDAADAQVIAAYGPAPVKGGIVASTGLSAGIPGTGPNFSGDAGLSWRTDPASGRRKLVLWGSAGGSLLFWSRKAVSSTLEPRPQIERKVAAAGLSVARNHPLFGDRVAISPPLLSLYAGRSGGLGLSVDVPPLVSVLGLGFPVARSNFSLYLVHPRLSPTSNRILDWTDRQAARVRKKLAPTIAGLRARQARLRAAAARVRARGR